MTAFDRVSQGGVELMLVSGYSGIGRIEEAQRHVEEAERLMSFVSGHFSVAVHEFYAALNLPLGVQDTTTLNLNNLCNGPSHSCFWRRYCVNSQHLFQSVLS